MTDQVSPEAIEPRMEVLVKACEALVFASPKPLSIDVIVEKYADINGFTRAEVKQALLLLAQRFEGSAIELVRVASGYRFQTREEMSSIVSVLWGEKPQKYSRALLETLALIAYRQPITRGDIEEIRGVAVSSNIIRTLLERDWVRVIGHREVPGRPAIYGTTKQFLDYFNLSALDKLPELAEMRDLDTIGRELSKQLELDTTPNSAASQSEELKFDAETDSGDRSLLSEASPSLH